MREILFRGKRADNEEWIEGLLVKQLDLDGTDELCIQTWKRDIDGVRSKVVSVIPSTVGQYTGLTDKNGRKIFEGDVVKDEQSQLFGKVVYATAADEYDGISGFMVDDIDDGLQNYNSFWHLVEVIGNICDNPELLNDEKEVEDSGKNKTASFLMNRFLKVN